MYFGSYEVYLRFKGLIKSINQITCSPSSWVSHLIYSITASQKFENVFLKHKIACRGKVKKFGGLWLSTVQQSIVKMNSLEGCCSKSTWLYDACVALCAEHPTGSHISIPKLIPNSLYGVHSSQTDHFTLGSWLFSYFSSLASCASFYWLFSMNLKKRLRMFSTCRKSLWVRPIYSIWFSKRARISDIYSSRSL